MHRANAVRDSDKPINYTSASHFASSLKEIPPPHIEASLSPPPFSLLPPLRSGPLPSVLPVVFSTRTLRKHLLSRGWPHFPTPGGSPLPHLLPLWESLVSTVLTYPLTLLSNLGPEHVRRALDSGGKGGASPGETSLLSSSVLVLGARREASLPSFYWLEVWYGLYFYEFNVGVRELRQGVRKARRRAYIEIAR
ncbi:hypothetical protein TeGR_g2667 [Tetraparma gracilis]|uniref:Uncharacterized protein n=1 Tax=Tetraparma gracilis TaxID=2962635 RepID=A0ABQ6MM18_9STRA|nr:hypothetical protein TeGR_g2667 [Tetraparma gracilis]